MLYWPIWLLPADADKTRVPAPVILLVNVIEPGVPAAPDRWECTTASPPGSSTGFVNVMSRFVSGRIAPGNGASGPLVGPLPEMLSTAVPPPGLQSPLPPIGVSWPRSSIVKLEVE